MWALCPALGCRVSIVDSRIAKKKVFGTAALRIVAPVADVGPFGNWTIESLEDETMDVEIWR
jgi:hypothetical protein